MKSTKTFIQERRTIRCPHCGSNKTAKIVYGLVDLDDELNKALESGKVVLGGCDMIIGEDERYAIRYCNDCHKDY